MKFGFSTFGCPGWTLEQACAEAHAMGYHGIELRLLDGQKVTSALSPAQRARIRTALADSGRSLSALASSVRLTDPDTDATGAELRGLLELAAACEAPAVRVFGGRLIDGEPRTAAVRRITALLTDLLPFAAHMRVRVALETHDDFSSAAHAAELLDAVASPWFTAIWDLRYTWRAGDSPRQAWLALGPHVGEIQVKDGLITPDGKWRQTLPGDGEIPVRECVAVAYQAGFDGWLVAEWEKHHHPELAEPEVALPAHRRAFDELIAAARIREAADRAS